MLLYSISMFLSTKWSYDMKASQGAYNSFLFIKSKFLIIIINKNNNKLGGDLC